MAISHLLHQDSSEIQSLEESSKFTGLGFVILPCRCPLWKWLAHDLTELDGLRIGIWFDRRCLTLGMWFLLDDNFFRCRLGKLPRLLTIIMIVLCLGQRGKFLTSYTFTCLWHLVSPVSFLRHGPSNLISVDSDPLFMRYRLDYLSLLIRLGILIRLLTKNMIT